ncbi:hypothetical protein, partial [Mycobacterium sp.]|uniref:hypothetical protein n=1 Tax=Mycobacterium sp. TaxID=1785 RepID=UPI003F9E0AD0
ADMQVDTRKPTAQVEAAGAIVAAHAAGMITLTDTSRPAVMLAYAITFAVNGWEVFPPRRPQGPPNQVSAPQGQPMHG